MTFLPVIERELRTISRRRLTYYLRLMAAGLVLIIATAVMIIAEYEPGPIGMPMGLVLFNILKWLCFIVVATAGIFLTADCLSEEKREGTLGLLFLTDLRGYDVVLGKLFATSLRAAYALLAVFPIMGLSLLMGGVGWRDFGRTALVLCNSLFFSLATGMTISVFSRDALKAMSGTMLMILLSCLALPMLNLTQTTPWPASVSILSPTGGLVGSSFKGADAFWINAAITHAVGWILLIVASLRAPRSWQVKAKGGLRQARSAAATQRAARQAKWLERIPVGWLANRERWLHGTVRAVVLGGMGLFVVVVLVVDPDVGWVSIPVAYVASSVGNLLALGLVLWLAGQACRFFTEGKRSGMLELLLATPLTTAEIVRGHWWALRRLFLLPAAALLIFFAAGGLLQVLAISGQSFRSTMAGYQLTNTCFGLLTFATGLWAVAWFGSWMGLTSRTTAVAVVKTIVLVKVAPWLVLTFMHFVLMISLARGGPEGMEVAPLVTGVLGLGLDILFVIISRAKVLANFREYVATGGRHFTPRRPLLPPPSVPPPLPPAPPVVS
jgi:ABC-type transport system involved in multi-copper enzyme maturation permease subunit